MTPLLTATWDDVRSRRVSRPTRKALEHELASYTSQAEQIELDAILDRADSDAAAEVRSIIQRNRMA